ncbi:peptidylprolyl isomerase [Thermoleptolyngbya oregonensis NK1-22]|uniref:peptidylprolyl isomerase n=1 Tax=Thermoleptolyngbya oregonensis NK1-22 TaxID=2547457 RepID=A0AA97BNS4_9CYAN|nr:peptidylprolyl isomerase [Thermoleptolyngbya oregonensis]WOB42133.1 peptidylprolyl isomerase [Thermoleptolyngbya oregonensis NK1-22]
MGHVLQIGNRSVTSEELPSLLAGYQMLPQLVQEVLIDEAIAPITCAEEELIGAREQFYAQHQIVDEATRQQWLNRHGMTLAQLDALATRSLRIEKFKEATWGAKLESYFLERKSKLDKVIYSLIRTQDMGIAQEIYFRVMEGEQSFAELARTYSQGPESQTDGLIGPVELSVPHPQLAHMLSISQPGQLWPPHRIGEWIVIIRLEKFIPAQMDEQMRRRLLNESFSQWLQQQLDDVSLSPLVDALSADALAAESLPTAEPSEPPAADASSQPPASSSPGTPAEPPAKPGAPKPPSGAAGGQGNGGHPPAAQPQLVPTSILLSVPDPKAVKPTTLSSSPPAAPTVAPIVES